MLSEIDNIVFPNRCEVIQLGASQRCLYPIMKNGSNSFYSQIRHGVRPDWKILSRDDWDKIQQPLITFIRNPKLRFVSGVNTYVQHLLKQNPSLDFDTIMWFVDQYLFLNRHYCPQFFWLVNLAKHFGADVELELKPMSDIQQYAGRHSQEHVEPPTAEFLDKIKGFNWDKLELYFFLDTILIDLIGQTVTFQQILDKVCQQPILKELVLTPTFNLTNVLFETRSLCKD